MFHIWNNPETGKVTVVDPTDEAWVHCWMWKWDPCPDILCFLPSPSDTCPEVSGQVVSVYVNKSVRALIESGMPVDAHINCGCGHDFSSHPLYRECQMVECECGEAWWDYSKFSKEPNPEISVVGEDDSKTEEANPEEPPLNP